MDFRRDRRHRHRSGRFDRPIYVAVLGSDSDGLARIAQDLAQRVRAIRGVGDVEVSVKPGLPAYAVRLNPGAVRELGLIAPMLASSLRACVKAKSRRTGRRPTASKSKCSCACRLRSASASTSCAPAHRVQQGRHADLARHRREHVAVASLEVIRRQNLQRREAIFAGVEGRPSGDAGKEMQAIVDSIKLPPGFSFDVGGSTKEQQEAFTAMRAALALSVIFIYIVLASQFGSFLQPIAIMASLPLSLICVMLALLFWRSTLNIFSMIGLVIQMGLVTKNAILLVDFANQGREAGLSIPDALLQAGLVRIRPIIMTTCAMVFGMLPLALALNEGGEIRAPIGRAIIGGVITSTLLTLMVVPVLNSYPARGRVSVAPRARAAGGAVPHQMPAAKD
jgi:multidrug efflux pump subunit AcrB